MISTLSLWRACQVPNFLEDCDRKTEPIRYQYSADESDFSEGETGGREVLDN